jgi:hypothetical protein
MVMPATRSESAPPAGFKSFKDKANYALGWGLIVLGVIDGAVDPIGGINAPIIFSAGMALIGADKAGDVLKK